MKRSMHVNFNLYGKLNDKEQDKWRKLEGEKWDEFRDQMQEKYHSPIYDQVNALDENILQLLHNMKECSEQVYSSLSEVGDAWISDVENLGTCSRQLRDLLERDL